VSDEDVSGKIGKGSGNEAGNEGEGPKSKAIDEVEKKLMRMAEEEIERYVKQGYRPRVKGKYITLRKGNYERVVGPYSEELWELVQSVAKKYGGVGGAVEEERVQAAIAGTTRGTGYLQELKEMIRAEIGRTRELTEAFYDYGISVLLAALSKTGTSMEEFRKVAKGEVSLKTALSKAAETVFKALDLYQSDVVQRFEERIRALEEERDEARAAYAYAVAKMREVTRAVERCVDPMVRLERVIMAYLAGGNVDPNVLAVLLDRWLGIEAERVREEIRKQLSPLLVS
jgi:hypothetical protein